MPKAERPQTGVIYEVNLEITPNRVAELDAWLPGHVAELLAQPGFLSARILKDLEPAPDGRARRSIRYRLRDQQALDDYLAGPAERLRADGIRRFGAVMRAHRRVLGETVSMASARGRCANCDTPLTGPYCAECGQRQDSPIQSLPRVLREVLDHVFNADSRIWRSLRDLLLRPGELTRRYLAGARVHYIPPFRLYILLSLAFFLSLSLLEGPELQLGGIQPGTEEGEVTDADAVAAAWERCRELAEMDVALPWMDQERMIRRARSVCLQVATGEGQMVYRQMMGNASTALFLMLPVMAVFMRLIYPLARRPVVAHLLFLTHFQAFAFLLLILAGLAAMVLDRWMGSGQAWLWSAVVMCLLGWQAIGLYRVFGQGILLTTLKFLLLAVAYLVGLSAFFLILLLYTVIGF